MADQRQITLYQGDASPNDIILRALPVADVVETTIWLFEGDATAKDIVLRDPTAAPQSGGDVTGTATSGQGGQSVDAVGTVSGGEPPTQGFVGYANRRAIRDAVEKWRKKDADKRKRQLALLILMSEL